MSKNPKCPKCGGELEDLWDGEPVSAFVGEWSSDRFRCVGLPKWVRNPEFGDWHWLNRTPSCGSFGLEDLGVEYREDGA